MPENYDGDGVEAAGRSIPHRGRRLRNLLLVLPQKRESLRHPPQIHAERDRLLIPSRRPHPPLRAKKKGFAAAAFRGLGCTTSSSQVHAPAVATASAAAAAVRSSADWQGKNSRARKKRSEVKKKERERKNQTGTAADLWCAPGMGFSSSTDASVDCVAPSFQQSRGPGPAAETERIQTEDAYAGMRSGDANLEQQLSSLLASPHSPFDAAVFGSDMIPPRHLHRARRIRRSPGGLDEIMMFQARLMLGEMDMHDRYRDWRLDVDSMTYEELLELGDKIGHVNTGLREEEIYRCLRKMKPTHFTSSPCQFSTELERKCSICQEDFEANDEVGKLDCGHGYHIYCIKQWLLRKNACPVCKATAC